MRGCPVDDHGAFENDGGIEFYEVLPIVRLFDRGGWENRSHERSVNTSSIPPLILFYCLCPPSLIISRNVNSIQNNEPIK